MANEVKDPRTGISYKTGMTTTTRREKVDANFKILGLMQQLAVIDRGLTDPPGSPSDGDAYIPLATATGDWAGHENDIAIWVDNDSAWTFLTPSEGWLCWINDEDVLSGFDGTDWTAGIALV